MSVLLTDPGDSAYWEITWDGLPSGVTLSSVTHTVPSPLTKVVESNTDTTSVVRVSGAKHGGIYQIEGSATLSNTEVINRQFTLVCDNG